MRARLLSFEPMRQPVELPKAYRLLNHGPTVLVGAAHDGRRNVMAAAWAMPLDFDPPKVAVVIDKSTFTRGLIEGSGGFVLSVPCRAQADLVFTVGSCSGREDDKFERLHIGAEAAPATGAPLIDGCVAWLECRLLPEPAIQQRHDLFLGQVVGAWADARVFDGSRWRFDSAPPELRTLHHLGAGAFVSVSDRMQARLLTH
jgi:flavin reductase (DIM6/NTAB) family NADH-FMN oxidoreductase RutF